MNIVYLFCVLICLASCNFTSDSCYIDSDWNGKAHPSNTVRKNKSVYIHNKTNILYENNAMYFVVLYKDIAKGKYILLYYSLPVDVVVPAWGWDYTLKNILPKSTVVKRGSSNYRETTHFFFHKWLSVHKTADKNFLSPPSELFKDTNHSFYLAFLNAGKRKVFFAPNKTKSEFVFYQKDKNRSSDGTCYQRHKHKDIFLKDTHITLEKEKATSNHKVVTEVIVDGKKVLMEALPIKKILVNNKGKFLRVADFK